MFHLISLFFIIFHSLTFNFPGKYGNAQAFGAWAFVFVSLSVRLEGGFFGFLEKVIGGVVKEIATAPRSPVSILQYYRFYFAFV